MDQTELIGEKKMIEHGSQDNVHWTSLKVV